MLSWSIIEAWTWLINVPFLGGISFTIIGLFVLFCAIYIIGGLVVGGWDNL